MHKSGNLFPLLAAIALVMAGCGRTQPASEDQNAQLAANGNLAPVSGSGQAAPESSVQQDRNPPAPADPAYTDTTPGGEPNGNTEPVYAPEPPPALPDYSQPPAPGDNYMWTPGYWCWSDSGYYWVPGAWVLAPYIDALWTPPWWQFDNGRYLWHAGYWGRYIGYYGGIDYGFGYTGRGYYGGYWNGGKFFYNRTLTNVNPAVVHNVYERRADNTTPRNHVSYNGGRGGVNARPTPAEEAALLGPRRPAVPAQVKQRQTSGQMRGQFAAAGRGRPVVVAQNNPLPTNYRKPAPRPELNKPAPRQSPEARQQQPLPEAQRPETQSRPPVETRPAQRVSPLPEPQGTRATRPEPYPEPNRPAPQERPSAPRRPEPQARPPVETRPAEGVRPAPESHPAQAARPEPARPGNAPGHPDKDKR